MALALDHCPDAARRGGLADVLGRLDALYAREHWHWMPGAVAGPEEVLAGAVLVQHTDWRNAERALEALRAAGALDTRVLATLATAELEALVRVSGTPSVKARRLRALARTVEDAGGVGAFLALPLAELRPRLLATHGIGPETADAIALYAAGQRVFVVDAYTRRLFGRLGLGPGGGSYDGWQRRIEDALPGAGVADFQRQHAAIVLHAKRVCRARPRCAECPLAPSCALASGSPDMMRHG
jgi:endonuclease-3 related protein